MMDGSEADGASVLLSAGADENDFSSLNDWLARSGFK